MTETVPLGPALRVQSVGVVIGDTGDETFDMMLEVFTSKGRGLGDIQRKTGITPRGSTIQLRGRDLTLTPIEPSLQFECQPRRPLLAEGSGDSIDRSRHQSA